APGVVRQWRILLMTVVAALLPLLSYLYIYLRGIAHPEWWGSGDWASGADWFWHFVSTSQGREPLGWGFEAWCTPWANGFPLLMAAELTWPVLLLGFLGFHLLGKRLGVLLWGTTLIYLLFSWAYRCGNWFQVILPLYPLLIIGLGSLIQRTFSFVAARRYGARWRLGLALGYLGVEICLLIAIGVRLVAVWPMVDSRNRVEDRALDQAAWLLSRPLPDGQALFASLDDTLALQYLTAIWGIEPTAQVASAHQAAQLLASGSTVFSTWEMAPTLRAELPPALGDVYQNAIDPNWIRFGLLAKREPVRNSGLGDNLLWEWPAPQSDWQMPQLVEQAVMPGVTLHGFQVMQRALSPLAAYRPSIAAGQGIDLLLLWSVADGNWPEDIAISVRLTVKGAMIDGLQIDRPAPAMGLNQPPTPLLPDPYFFAIPTEQRMMIDGARLILYRSTTDGFTNVAEV
ncbi:MAG: hypothetical protein KDE31_29270, partial [Caldilineaceae bacterium]|nr:hypothetical protein [Caldilineaceae bacterium]